MAGAGEVPCIAVDVPCIAVEDDIFSGLNCTEEVQSLPFTMATGSFTSTLSCDFSQLKERKQSTSTPVSTRTDTKVSQSASSCNDSGFECALNLSESCLSSHEESDASSSVSMASSLTDTRVTYCDIGLSLAAVSLSRDLTSHSHRSLSGSFDSGAELSFLSSVSSCISDASIASATSPDTLCTSYGTPHTPLDGMLTSYSTPLTSHNMSHPNSDLDFTELLEKFSPREPDRLIGRKMGLEHVDILTELDARNICCVSVILRMLSASDLCRMCRVSKQWKSVCQRDWPANSRRLQFLLDVSTRKDKENKVQTTPKKHRLKRDEQRGSSPLKVTQRALTTGSSPLKVVQVTGSHHAAHRRLPAKHPSKMKLFMEEATKLKNDESLRKCPRCQSPAKVHHVQERACCINKNCSYDFCIKCRNEFHGSKDCTTALSKKTKTESSVSSRKSKRNLRRL